jgi:hypothetical protein
VDIRPIQIVFGYSEKMLDSPENWNFINLYGKFFFSCRNKKFRIKTLEILEF